MHKKLGSVSTESPSHFSYLGEAVNRLVTQSPGQDILSRVEHLDKKRGAVPEYCLRLRRSIKQTYKRYLQGQVVEEVEEDANANMNTQNRLGFPRYDSDYRN